MRILGVDPGTRLTGVGVIETVGSRYNLVYYGVIKPKANAPISQRLKTIYEELNETIRTYKPDVLAIEDIFYGKDYRAMIKLGEARACAMLAAAGAELEISEYPPARVKQSISGNGRATKEQIQQMVKTLLSLKELPPTDSADALAVAICHLHSSNLKSLKLLVSQ